MNEQKNQKMYVVSEYMSEYNDEGFDILDTGPALFVTDDREKAYKYVEDQNTKYVFRLSGEKESALIYNHGSRIPMGFSLDTAETLQQNFPTIEFDSDISSYRFLEKMPIFLNLLDAKKFIDIIGASNVKFMYVTEVKAL